MQQRLLVERYGLVQPTRELVGVSNAVRAADRVRMIGPQKLVRQLIATGWYQREQPRRGPLKQYAVDWFTDKQSSMLVTVPCRMMEEERITSLISAWWTVVAQVGVVSKFQIGGPTGWGAALSVVVLLATIVQPESKTTSWV